MFKRLHSRHIWSLLPIIVILIALSAYFFAPFSSIGQRNHVRKVLKSMTEEERMKLDIFFRLILFKGQFAYSLYGDKPMSEVNYVERCERGDYGGIRYSNLSMANEVLRCGWQIWQQYRSYFPAKNYLLYHFVCENDAENAFILLINKKAFERTFAENRADFIFRFGVDITAEKILEKCLGKNGFLNSDLKSFHELIGILFGYGSINAHLFQRREDLETQIELHPLLGLSYYKQIEKINSQLQFFQDDRNPGLQLMLLPYFVADCNHHQTIALKQKYESQRKDIARHYKNGDFLELTLLQLTE